MALALSDICTLLASKGEPQAADACRRIFAPTATVDDVCSFLEGRGNGQAAMVCRAFAQRAAQYAQPVAQALVIGNTAALTPSTDAGKCGCGGTCGQCGPGCSGNSCGLPPSSNAPYVPALMPGGPSVPGGGCGGGGPNIPNWAKPGAPMPPKCYDCGQIDPCLYQYLCDTQLKLTPWEYEQLRVNENPNVNLDKYVGAVPFQDFPYTAGTSGLFAQADAQKLPYRPCLVKAQPEWTGTPANSKVILTFYAGPSGLTNLSNTDQLIQIGSPFKLSNFVCADDCYFGPFPEFELCKGSAIPFERSVYVKIQVGAVGQSTLNGLGLELIKHRTFQAQMTCTKCGFNGICN